MFMQPIPDAPGAPRPARLFPAPSIGLFLVLQALDVITTLIGLRVGASEGSLYIGRLMQVTPLGGLLASKVMALALACAAYVFRRQRLLVFVNFWFAAVVTWNLVAILLLVARR